MLPGLDMMACPNLAVPAEVMQHVVKVESSHNPFAIGVVGGQLVRQPQNLGEALATVRMLEDKGYNFSVGLAQVNRSNLGKYGLDSYEKAFDACTNLSVGARILSQCYASSGNDWGKAFSCYYSGNFVTGYRDGYVQKIYDSINRSIQLASNSGAAAIPLQQAIGQATNRTARQIASATSDGSAYRVAIRSVALDAVANSLVTPAVATAAGLGGPAAQTQPQLPRASAVMTNPSLVPTMPTMQQAPQAAAVAMSSAPVAAGNTNDIFVPQVHGPNDSIGAAPVAAMPAAAAPTSAQAFQMQRPGDQADLRQGGHDDAFVF